MFLNILAMTPTEASLMCSWSILAPTASIALFLALGSWGFSSFAVWVFRQGPQSSFNRIQLCRQIICSAWCKMQKAQFTERICKWCSPIVGLTSYLLWSNMFISYVSSK